MHPYFSAFNYSLANEDTFVERHLFEGQKHIFCIGGSGSRVLPLLNSSVETLRVNDLSAAQLAFIQFKIKLLEQVDLQTYRQILGYERQTLARRKQLLSKVQFTEASLDFVRNIPDELLQRGLIYCGRWESYLLKVSGLIRSLSFFDFSPLFETQSLEEQQRIFAAYWPEKRMKVLLYVFANPQLMNLFLYRGQMAVSSEETLLQLLDRNFHETFTRTWARKSFFHQLLFLGELRHEEGFPAEVQTEVFEEAKRFRGQIIFEQKDLLESLPTSGANAFSLSDVLSYLTIERAESLSAEVGSLLHRSNGVAVIRSFLRHPPLSLKKTVLYHESLSKAAEQQDSTRLYQIQVFKKV